MDDVEIFKKNGFDFIIDEDGECSSLLFSLPMYEKRLYIFIVRSLPRMMFTRGFPFILGCKDVLFSCPKLGGFTENLPVVK